MAWKTHACACNFPSLAPPHTHLPLTKTQFHLTLFNNLHCCFRNRNKNNNCRRKVLAATTTTTTQAGQQKGDTFSLSLHTHTHTLAQLQTYSPTPAHMTKFACSLPFSRFLLPFHFPHFGIMHCLISHLFLSRTHTHTRLHIRVAPFAVAVAIS